MNMPSGPLLDIIKEVGKGELANVSKNEVNDIVVLLKERKFDDLAAKGVSIANIVAFTSRFEGKGVGLEKKPEERGAFLAAMLGGKGDKGTAYGVADFFEKSAIWDVVGGLGGGIGAYGTISDLISEDSSLGFLKASDQTKEDMELEGGIIANTAMKRVIAMPPRPNRTS